MRAEVICVSLFDALFNGLAHYEAGWTRRRLIPHDGWRASDALYHNTGDVQVLGRDFSIILNVVRYPIQHPDFLNSTTHNNKKRM
jgi:hypothetical protein